MNSVHKRRIWLVSLFLCGIALVIALVLYALQQNINLFYTPAELLQAKLPADVRVRIGGLVQTNSVKQSDDLLIKFTITDNKQDLEVHYSGVLPDLFREGQGVVALGTLQRNGDIFVFKADQILAKHDENYMPPGLTEKLAQADHDS